ncbi:MAG TPA: hypothetical protein VNV38_00495 [Stellaceae bacterium]|jgi:hypothetical protein|nr:hypothetical protein [Stellaceae bacterium]
MAIIYVARSVKAGKWASDVGLGKHVYKLGVTDDDPKQVAAAGWAGETDWSVVKAEPVDGLEEAEAIDRLAAKERMIDPNLYPKLKGARGVFRLNEVKVENHFVVARALSGESELKLIKLKPADYAAYMILNAKR